MLKKDYKCKNVFRKRVDYLDIVQKGFTKSSAMKYEPEYFQKYDVVCSVFEANLLKDVLH